MVVSKLKGKKKESRKKEKEKQNLKKSERGTWWMLQIFPHLFVQDAKQGTETHLHF